MSEKLSSNQANDITAEACAWIAQIESEGMTSDDLAAFKEWIERSAAHKAEIRRLAQLSGEINILTEMASPLKDAAARQRELINPGHSSRVSKNYWSKNYFTAGIALATVLFFSFIFIIQQNDSLTTPQLYTTAVGGHREVILSDGTLLALNTDSEVEVDYNENRRKVRLLKGEAFFQVAHNSNRPFIVYAGKNSVRAVGTAFAVSLLPQTFELTVTEGKVELSDTAKDKPIVSEQKVTKTALLEPSKDSEQITDEPEKIYLSAGETLAYNPLDEKQIRTEQIKIVSEREIRRQLSWQDGLLDFSETPLIEVVEDLSRYTSLEIEILDPELRNMKFGGLFRTDELQALFDALETTFDIKVVKVNDKLVRLSRNSPIDS
ncbi:FecR family protein [Aliikangiella coralliicola]|uniref:DUF4974 domain-containing protein n=1 Tax=Aliikangiella coralliicola TaxID=2592383 RepID=A0A545UJE2_9GAMM|nr:FecR domain-containing protein [Aliikangiella coralliicola]TQV89581.1 DUF4974 domain-containing protein [Aliikangiella coralliicola]